VTIWVNWRQWDSKIRSQVCVSKSKKDYKNPGFPGYLRIVLQSDKLCETAKYKCICEFPKQESRIANVCDALSDKLCETNGGGLMG